MNKKILGILIAIVTIVVVMSNVQAANGLVQAQMYQSAYKMSEEEDIVLPFFNGFDSVATYDKQVNHSGITIAKSTLSILDKMKGMQFMLSGDMLEIKGELENAVVYGKNLIVEGKITGDTILMGTTVQIMEDAEISGDVLIFANELEFKGNAEANVVAIASESAEISGTIDKDLRIMSNNCNLENSKISGNVYVKTNADTAKIKELYPKATFSRITKLDENNGEKLFDTILKGVVLVVVYTICAYFLTKKDNNIVTKMTNKFKKHVVYGVIMGLLALMLAPIIITILIMGIANNLGIIAWPILIAYISLLLFTISISTFIVGTSIYESLRDKLGKYKVLGLAIIFAVLYTLTEIKFTAAYMILAMILISISMVITMFTKKESK